MQATPFAQLILILLSAFGVELSPELKSLVTDNLGVALAGFAATLGAIAKVVEVYQKSKGGQK